MSAPDYRGPTCARTQSSASRVLAIGDGELGLGDIASNFVWERTEKWFDRIVAHKHLGGAEVVYGYEHACLETFRAQKALGGLCIYDRPIAHHRTVSKILNEEFKKFPEMKTSRDVHLEHRRYRYNARKDCECAG